MITNLIISDKEKELKSHFVVSWVGSNSYLAMLKNMAKINMLEGLKILQDDNAKKSMMNMHMGTNINS